MQDLDKFKNDMNLSGKNVYVGHRYVPKIMGDWDNTQIYEPLSIVQYQGGSFTSRQYVPSGVEITNEEYWAVTGNYNAQVEQYRQDVRNLEKDTNNLNNEVIIARNGHSTLGKRLEHLVINAYDIGCKADGTNDATAVNAFLSENTDKDVLIKFNQGDFNFDSNVTFPKNVTVEIDRDAYIDVPDGVELIFDGGLIAERAEIFSTTGSIHGRISSGEIFPEWFGADSKHIEIPSEDIQTKNTLALNKAFYWADKATQFRSGSAPKTYDAKVSLTRGTYFINDSINTSGVSPHLEGIFGQTHIRSTNMTAPILDCNPTDNHIKQSGRADQFITMIPNDHGGIGGGLIKDVLLHGGRGISFVSSNAGGYLHIENVKFFYPGLDIPHNPKWFVYIDAVSANVSMKNIESSGITKFLWVKSDGFSLDGLNGSVYSQTKGTLPSNTAYIENHTRMMKIDNGVLTIDGDGGVRSDKDYRIVDNYGSIKLANISFDAPSNGRPLIWNYSRHTGRNWGEWNEETYKEKPSVITAYNSRIVIENVLAPVKGNEDGSVTTRGLIVLKDGVPAITEIKNVQFLLDAPYIAAAAEFDLDKYLKNTNGYGTMSIMIKNNNVHNPVESLTGDSRMTVPKQLKPFSQIDTSHKFSYDTSDMYSGNSTYLPKIKTDMLAGQTYLQTSTWENAIGFDTDIYSDEIEAGVYLLTLIANTNPTASPKYRDVAVGIMTITTGFNTEIARKVEFHELFNATPVSLPTGAPVVSATWYDGSVESANISASRRGRLRVKASDFSSAGSGGRLNLVCLNKRNAV